MLKLPNSYKKNHVKIFINQIEIFEMSFNNIHESTATNVFSMLVSAIFFVFLYFFFKRRENRLHGNAGLFRKVRASHE